ncbi:low affinity iron permease family protein [Xanthobacter autotrophicus]|uniref:Low affinity iron permease family protein n=1 Tax=Xanthobacter autotrophicus TaxID=280 RepID=A0A6C1KIZ0_XANAU|nr:low affinity iron permease family protein [Xanthobacter autotrophicus]TLX44258.1 low affinity iron permease family protein [Xanthobacter autotrophicus]
MVAQASMKELRRQVEQGRAPRPLFTRFSQMAARYTGKPATFIGAMAIIVVWGMTGPLFGFNDTWQLVINTSTSIVTFLMVFLIQNSQNRDTAALQIKLDELIARLDGPREVLLDLEDLDEETLERLRLEHALLADKARERSDSGAGPEASSPAPADPSVPKA